MISEQVSFAKRALRQAAGARGIAAPGRFLEVAAEEKEGRSHAFGAQHVEQRGGARAGPVVEGQREHGRSVQCAAVKTLRLVQLPVPPPAALAATGNVPLAAGCLAVA